MPDIKQQVCEIKPSSHQGLADEDAVRTLLYKQPPRCVNPEIRCTRANGRLPWLYIFYEKQWAVRCDASAGI